MKDIEEFFTILFNIIRWIFSTLNELFTLIFSDTPTKSKGYNADFASSNTVLSAWNYGFCLTGRRNITLKDSYQNALVIGGTGVGKSSVVLLPTLYSMNASFIVHDPSGELLEKSAGFKHDAKAG